MHRGSKGGILVSVLIGFVIVLALAAFTVYSIIENVRVEEMRTASGHHAVKVETPFGGLRVEERSNANPKHLGVPIYPGAERSGSDGKLISVEIERAGEHKDLSLAAAEFTTPDSPDRVVEFYKKQLPHWIIASSGSKGVQMEYSEEGYKRFVFICQEHARTKIAIASMGEPLAN